MPDTPNPDNVELDKTESSEDKGEVVIESKATIRLNEEMLQCLNGDGLTVTTVTVT